MCRIRANSLGFGNTIPTRSCRRTCITRPNAVAARRRSTTGRMMPSWRGLARAPNTLEQRRPNNMAWWTENNSQLKTGLAGKSQFVEEDSLVTEPDTFAGPTANAVRAAFPDLLGWVKLTDKPWAQGADTYHGIGVN